MPSRTVLYQRQQTIAVQMSHMTDCQMKCKFEYHQHRNDIPVNDYSAMFLVVYNVNKRGPSTEPCGTPHVSKALDE